MCYSINHSNDSEYFMIWKKRICVNVTTFNTKVRQRVNLYLKCNFFIWLFITHAMYELSYLFILVQMKIIERVSSSEL